MTVENLSGRRVQHLLRPVGFNSQSAAGYISYPGKCHSNVIRCFKCFKCNFFQCFIDRFCRGGGMSWKFSKKEEKKCPMTGRTLKCFINDCCFLCWLNFLLFDLMLIFKSFISATPLILLTAPRPRKLQCPTSPLVSSQLHLARCPKWQETSAGHMQPP